jgi:hypothetical protein
VVTLLLLGGGGLPGENRTWDWSSTVQRATTEPRSTQFYIYSTEVQCILSILKTEVYETLPTMGNSQNKIRDGEGQDGVVEGGGDKG